MPDSIIIGAAIVDIPLSPVTPDIFTAHSTPLQRIAMGLGGDAANEALVLARLGHAPALVSVVGDDATGDYVRRTRARAGVDTCAVTVRPGLDTGINGVLVRPDGERGFITSRSGSPCTPHASKIRISALFTKCDTTVGRILPERSAISAKHAPQIN